MTQQDRNPNLLIGETSPYLLQHAYNPVKWFPWGDEAFEKARKEDKPVFLSTGYSTCHWCHVMERESFENETIAALLNRSFVSVKVDREEHPDIDRLYMTYVQATTGRGGWPMSVWLTPDRRPFFGGSYFPPADRYGQPGFYNLLLSIERTWKQDKARLVLSADRMFAELTALSMHSGDPSLLSGKTYHDAADVFKRQYDPAYGGFGEAPKFPQPSILDFLLAYSFYTGKREYQDMVLFTLRKMNAGGIHDHIGVGELGGGGFARYSTDRRWHVPHFEKMLYDNAQLASTFIDAFRISGDRSFASCAEDILNYVLCDMSASEGGFYSAEDADSIPAGKSVVKKEGSFYLWSRKEVEAVLDRSESELFCYVYGVKGEGNVQDDPHEEFDGQNVLMIEHVEEDAAGKFGIPHETVKSVLENAKRKLFETRQSRPRPDRDDKILTSWNGLMISAFCKAYNALGNSKHLDAAKRAASFILENLLEKENGRLLRRYRNGVAGIRAKADDYAFFIQALLDLYEASFDPNYQKTAISLMEKQIELCYDEVTGGFFSTPSDDTSVPLRMKEDYDGAEPSSDSITLRNLLRLGEISERDDFTEVAEKTIECYSEILNTSGYHLPAMLTAAMIHHSGIRRVELTGTPGSASFERFRKTLEGKYLPDTAIIQVPPSGEKGSDVSVLVCENNACHPPVTDPEALEKLIEVPRRLL
ncbi:MAG: thioredoxin domain-containing protein [Chlorobiaceae bacterium]|nr:thioredoxin domain-containing protein [Chlorobiaceae bacterium]